MLLERVSELYLARAVPLPKRMMLANGQCEEDMALRRYLFQFLAHTNGSETS